MCLSKQVTAHTNSVQQPKPSQTLPPAGTGATEDIGVGRGTNYSVNVPLAEGMDDESYHFMFEPIMQQVGHGVLVFGFGFVFAFVLAGCLPKHAAGLIASLLLGLLKSKRLVWAVKLVADCSRGDCGTQRHTCSTGALTAAPLPSLLGAQQPKAAAGST